MNATDKIKERIAGLKDMLARQKVDLTHEQCHVDEGSRESLYWHYGYMMALKDVLGLLGDGETRQ